MPVNQLLSGMAMFTNATIKILTGRLNTSYLLVQEQFQMYLAVIPEMKLKEKGSMPPTEVTCNLLLTTSNLTIAYVKDHQKLKTTDSSSHFP